jgi:hypothetical protein
MGTAPWRRMWSVSFMPLQFNPGETAPGTHWIRGSRFGCYAEEKYLLPLPGIEHRFLGRPARSLVTIPNEPARLPKKLHL